MRYAAYGSNLHPIRLRRRAASAQLLGTVALPGWQLRLHKRGQDGSAKCNIVGAPGVAYVAVFEMAASDRPKLDQAEGLNRGYIERQLDVPGFDRCFLYLASDSHIDEELVPFTWYKELVLLGCEHHGFPHQYVDWIRALPAHRDRDRQRHAKNMAIVEKIRQGRSGLSA